MKIARLMLLSLTALSTPVLASPLPATGFESGDLSRWTSYGDASALATDELDLGGSIFKLDAHAGFMARILPNGSAVMRDEAESLLSLAPGTFVGSGVTGLAESTNFGFITGFFTLTAGTYSFGWSYAAQDYAPFDDGVFFSLVGTNLSQVNVLASNFTGQPNTVIVGTYGSTPWQLTSFTLAEAGTYQLGFGAYNWGDTIVDPVLYLDDGVGSLSQDGVIVPPATPAIDTALPYYVASALDLGTILPIFDGGTLQVDSARDYTTSLIINAAGGTIDTASIDATFSGNIEGTGSLIKVGSGTLTLAGISSYTGGTTIAAGTVVGHAASLQGDIVDDAVLIFNQASNGIYSGNLSGTGSLVKAGEGLLTLTGINSHTGGTAITAGALAGNAASLQGDIIDNGALIFNQSNDGTYGGSLSGRGSLLKTGAGTLTLSGVNTHTGGTTVTAGALVGNTVSLQGDIVDNAALVFNQTSSGTYSGSLSGAGSLVKTGGGRLTLSGDYSYTGTTIVMDGSVHMMSALPHETDLIAEGGTLDLGTHDQTVHSLSGSAGDVILNNNIFTVDQASNTQFGGAIDGTGSLVKTGAGRLNLTGESNFTGQADVDAGKLAVNGSLGAIVHVNGGTIGGNGTIGGLIVHAGGTAAPGNSIGTIHVTGDVNFAGGSTYVVETDAAGRSDNIIATGNMTIRGGNVSVLAGTDDYAPLTIYTILTAAGARSGSFTDVTTDLAYLTPFLSYDANRVVLTLGRNDIHFSAVAHTANQQAAAGAAEQLGVGNPIWNAAVQLSAAEAPAAYDNLSGEVHASVSNTIMEDARKARSAVLDRLSESDDNRISVWGRLFGSWGSDDGNGNAAHADHDTTGMLTGIDAQIADVVRVGIGGGYTATDLKAPMRASKAKVRSAHFMGYGGGTFGAVRIRIGIGYSQVDLRTDRTVAVGRFSDQLRADYKGSVLQSFGEIGYAVPLGAGSVSPFASLAAVRMRTSAFTESGGAAALNGIRRYTKNQFSVAGIHIETPDVGPLSIRATMGWQRSFGHIDPVTAVRFGNDPAFQVAGAPLSRDAVLLETELGMKIGPDAWLRASYASQIGDQGQDHAIRANLTISF